MEIERAGTWESPRSITQGEHLRIQPYAVNVSERLGHNVGTMWASGHVGMTVVDHLPGMCKLLLPEQSKISVASLH
jgi:hypothetical protein